MSKIGNFYFIITNRNYNNTLWYVIISEQKILERCAPHNLFNFCLSVTYSSKSIKFLWRLWKWSKKLTLIQYWLFKSPFRQLPPHSPHVSYEPSGLFFVEHHNLFCLWSAEVQRSYNLFLCLNGNMHLSFFTVRQSEINRCYM